MTRGGVIGLGEIGSGVALCLARAGLLAAVYDIRADAAEGLAGVPSPAASPAEVARAGDVVIVAVVDAAQTIAVLSGPDGVLAAARPGLSVVLVATVGPGDLARIRALTDAAGVALIDCGVVGGPRVREKGLICLVGATEDDLARVRPVLDGFARSVAHMGGPGAGMAGKVVYNAIFISLQRAGYEGVELARATGVDLGQLSAVFRDSAESSGGPFRIAGMPGDGMNDLVEARRRQAMCAIASKDLDAALEVGRATGTPLPLVEFVRARMYETFGTYSPVAQGG